MLPGPWRLESLPSSSGCDSSDCAYCCALARLRRPNASPKGGACWLRRKRSRTDLAGMGDATPCSSCGGGEEGDGEPGGGVHRVPSSGTLMAVSGLGAPGSSMWDHALLVEDSEEEAASPAASPRRQTDAQWVAAVPPGGAGGAGQPPSSSAAGVQLQLDLGADPGSSGAAAGEASGWGWHPHWQAPAGFSEATGFLPPGPHAAQAATADIVCSLEFEEHGWLLATAGVTKQVRVYSLASRLQHPDSEAYLQPLRCHRMPSKLSSLAWNPDAPGAVTVADYDGVVSQVDMESGHLIAEADEHCGRRVWSVSHSLQRPHLLASASDDGTVRLWGGPAMQCCLAALRPGAAGAPASGVHLSPFDGNLAAVASADHNAYVFDLRRADAPLLQLAGHARAVSYVRWLGPNRLATASTDASLALWQLPAPQQQQQQQRWGAGGAADAAFAATAPAGGAAPRPPAGSPTGVLEQPWRRLRGHRNSKNFCGLAVRPEDGLLACGSEAPSVYAYHEAWAAPLAVHRFAGGSRSSSPGGGGGGGVRQRSPSPPQQQRQQQDLFCSAVAWQPATARPGRAPLLAAALSSGELRVLELRRAPAEAAERRCSDS